MSLSPGVAPLSWAVVTTPALAVTRAHAEGRNRLAEALERRRVRDGVVLLDILRFTALWFHRLMFNMNDAVLYGPNDASYGIRQYWGAEYWARPIHRSA